MRGKAYIYNGPPVYDTIFDGDTVYLVNTLRSYTNDKMKSRYGNDSGLPARSFKYGTLTLDPIYNTKLFKVLE